LQLFEVVIFTASQPAYANVLVDWLDPTKTLVKSVSLAAGPGMAVG
jgi:TFIIF-interacting CTD phosphatase-like protein